RRDAETASSFAASPRPCVSASLSPRVPASSSARLPAAYRFLWCWVAVYFVCFSVAATKLPNYVLPVYAPLALLTARFLDRWRRGAVRPPAWAFNLSLGLVALAGVLAGVGLLLAGGLLPLPAMRGRALPGLEAWAVLGVLPVLGAAGGWWYA